MGTLLLQSSRVPVELAVAVGDRDDAYEPSSRGAVLQVGAGAWVGGRKICMRKCRRLLNALRFP